ncbi:MAG: DUF2089 domain-containing protein [Eubacteriales bacterium]|nr:DUF2089 domain-containing protein [Eubacteriales bacterium]
MIIKQPGACPVCKGRLTVTKISCESCGTELTGRFPQCKYCALDERLGAFLETFLRCKGNIKDIEKELSISYPTVKNLIDELLSALGIMSTEPDKENSQDIIDILAMVESGEITAAQASKLIRERKKK